MPTGDEEKTPLIPAITLEGSQSGSPRPDQLKPKAATATPRAKSQEALDTAPSTSSRSTRSVSKMAQKAIDIALKKFIAATDRVSHFEADLHTPAAPDTDRLPPGMCQIHRALWEKVVKSYESCSDLLAESDDSPTIASELESKYSYCYSVFSKCVFQLQGVIDRAAFQPTQASANLFTAIYIHNSRLTPVEKLFHLLSKTSGDAQAIVSKAPLTNEGFISAWQSLTDRFENRRLLVNSQLKILFNLPAVPQESGAALKELQGTIQSCLTALSMSSIQVETWDCLLVYMVSIKLPKTTLSMWEQSVHNKAEIPTWNELNSFLTERHRTLEAIDDIRPSSSGQFFESSQIDVLIGADILPSVLLGSSKANICGSLFGQETIFGWVLTGPIFPNASRNVSAFSTRVTCGSDDSLDQLLTKFWEVEEVPSQIVSESDSVCERNFVRTTRRDSCGKYVVTLPLRDPEHGGSELSSSRSFALAQFLRNEQRLKRDPPLKARYDSVIQEYLDLGHMAAVSPKSSSATYYLPHHAVLKPESTTTKVRVVFNASSPPANETSLNDILYAGPVLQSDLTLQILKWRYFRFVFNADIEKMYRQIWVDPKHTPFQRILFRNPDGEIRDYELKTVTFGVNCAPFLAIRVLQQLADDEESRYPRASRIIRQFMYVDDVLAGADSITEAQVAIRELQGALSSAGFPLRKWTSNNKAILANIPSGHLLHSDFLELDSESTAKTLGVRWKATSDEFFFIPPKLVSESSFTKRQVLSQIAKLFDPAGWLAPFVVRAKMFMQDIWLQDLGWDDTLPQDFYQRWIDFLENYSALDNIRIPRWVTFRPHLNIEHHGFCDASQKAYGAAIYVRVEVGSTVEVTLLTARTRVAPVKTLSLPRLELCGALLLSEMAAAILPKMPGPPSALHCWTDSTIVLAWLRKPACHWTTFVANRVTKITQFTEVEKWAHVRSERNPADLASRGVALQDLADSQLWWHEPAWLRRPRSEWPMQGDVSPVTDLEKRAVKVHVAKVPPEDILERFSTLDKALRVLAYVHRFIQRSRKLLSSVEDHLTASEIVSAELRLISVTQHRHFTLERGCLRQKRPIPTSSLVQNLNPFLDSNGLMRACGRVTTSELLQYDERHPIILPYDCHLSRLIVHFTHRITLHGGNQLMIRLIRSKFWIPWVKNLVKSVIYSCKVCVIHKRKLQTQLMGDLPKERTSFSRPFTYTGMDYAGPFDIKNYTGRACLITKGYVLVFVCFSTKAIHLEPTSDLTTEKFLAAFARFVSRRGCPRQVQSDNGKTFVGAAAQLSRDFLHALKEAVTGAYSHQQLLWQFIPPGAPHMGGLWEAGVKSFKTLFYKSTATRKYTFEELATLLARIEACLNSRPLAPMSEDPADLLAFTPGHFLVGGPLLAVVEPEIKGVTTSIINRWQHLKALHQHFRLRWKEEYLKELHKRNKWRAPTRNLRAGDMVVVKEDNLPSNEWRLERVDAVFPGVDGHVRVVDIRTARGLIKRPIAKVVLLPMEEVACPQ
ncbi:uncharacterized protein [Drosophila kikkawai]|uniref:Integrase catalytic domain-containing protein n=1 Tax=Drosophila kikkawai TaxID=30033 RepID=A0ABM4GHW9_DROKI